MIIACVASVRALFSRPQAPRYDPDPHSGRMPLKKQSGSGWGTQVLENDASDEGSDNRDQVENSVS